MSAPRLPIDPSATSITSSKPRPARDSDRDLSSSLEAGPARRSRAQMEELRRKLGKESQKATVLRPIRREVVGATPVSRDTRLDPVLMNRPPRRLREEKRRPAERSGSVRRGWRGWAFLVVLLVSATSLAAWIAFAGVCALCLLT